MMCADSNKDLRSLKRVVIAKEGEAVVGEEIVGNESQVGKKK